MNRLISLFLLFLPLVAYAESCVREFNEDKLMSEIIGGKQIHTPFTYGYLIEGRYEPELKEEAINIGALSRIVKILKFQHNYALSTGGVKLIKSNNSTISVKYRGANSGYNTEYIFKNIHGCWNLVGFIDWST